MFSKLKLQRTKRIPGLLLLAAVLVAVPGIFTAKLLSPPGCKSENFTVATLPAQADAVPPGQGGPVVYLTFDDGPSGITEQVLDTLDSYGVKASFFVIGVENAKYQPLMKRMADAGHCVALHTYSHSYKTIYASSEAFWKDIGEMQHIVAENTGAAPTIFRFPGGSSNSVCKKYGGKGLMKRLANEAEEKGYTYIDWNVSAEDSNGGHPSAQTIAQRVLRGCKGKKCAVVLMHDSAACKATMQALPAIIEGLQEQGFTFSTVDQMTSAMHHVKTDAETAAEARAKEETAPALGAPCA